MQGRRISQTAVTDVEQASDQRTEQRNTHSAELHDDMPDAPHHESQRPSSSESHATPAHEIVNPISGERIIIRTSGAQTNGQLLAFDLYLPPGGHVPAGHRHPSQEERFTIVSGKMRFRLGRHTLLAHPGETIAIPIGVAHWFGNVGSDVAHAYVEVRPALRMEELFKTTEALSQRTGARAPQSARPLLATWPPLKFAPWLTNLALVALEFQQEVAAPHVPAPLARAALSLLSWPARRSSHQKTRRAQRATPTRTGRLP